MVQETRKDVLRQIVWRRLEVKGLALFPGTQGRIPNFRGATEAAALLATLPEWREAQIIQCSPDSPQQPVRKLALEEGKWVYMAIPRLARRKCFRALDPWRVPSALAASTIVGAARYGKPVSPKSVPAIDLIVVGSVVVSPWGERLGKGGGYSDIEFALGRELGFVSRTTPIVTTVHPVQIMFRSLPVLAHDIPVDVIVTPETVMRVRPRRSRPKGIDPKLLSEDQIYAMPSLWDILT